MTTECEQSMSLPAREAVKLGVAAQEAMDKFRHAGLWNVKTDPIERAAQNEAYEVLRVEMVQAINRRDAALAALK